MSTLKAMNLMTKFTSRFDPSVKEHVEWLKLCTDHSEQPSPEIARTWTENPWGIGVSSPEEFLQTAEIYFVLMAKYSKAVFKNEAYILPPPVEEI